jgi:hypothetical protein
MVSLTLVILAGTTLIWKMSGWIERSRFQSYLEKLRSRFFVCQRLAMMMQVDWRGTLHKEKGKWVFESFCVDPSYFKRLPPLSLHSLTVVFEENVQDNFSVDFFSTGILFPQGPLTFYQDPKDPKAQTQVWILPNLFQFEGGDGEKNLSPLHPDEIL